MSWAYAYAYRSGADHERCDDVCVCETLGDYLIAAISDGAGSAPQAHAGASIACQTFVELGVQIFSGTLEPPCLLAAIQSKLPDGQAEAHSCTLVGVVAGPKGALFLQVGDGAAVFIPIPQPPSPSTAQTSAQGEGGFQVALWPEETEFLNHTFFVTMPDAEKHLQIRRLDQPVAEVALFSDGLQHLVLDLKTEEPHQPFFESVFKRLGNTAEHDRKTSWWLERTLASEQVTKRTDDDTSIVIARRLAC